jgi:hypothetical protein
LLKDNPAVALPPAEHRTIKNLKSADVATMSPSAVLQYHLDQLKAILPDFVLVMPERESRAFIKRTGL